MLAAAPTGAVPTGAALAGVLAATALLAAGPVMAASCGGAVPAGSSCSLAASMTLTGGSLTLSSPSSLSWAATLNGGNQTLYDANGPDESYVVNDATGSGAGWNVTVAATTFSSGGHVLASTGTLSTNGSLSSAAATAAPAAACYAGVTCTLPSNSLSYPVAITTAASSPAAVKIYDNSANAGIGELSITNVGWWVTVPANAPAGTYTSTFTFQVNSGP